MQPSALVGGEAVQRPRRRLGLTRVMALLYVASIPFDGLALGSRSLPFLVGGVYVFCALMDRLVSKKPRSENLFNHSWPMVAFSLFCLVSYFWSLAPSATVAKTATLFLAMVTGLLVAGDLATVKSSLVALFYVAGATPAALLVIAAPANIDDRRTANGNANDVAIALLVAVACCLYVLASTKGKARFLALLAAPISLYATMTTGSRTALVGALAMVVGGVVLLIYQRKIGRVLIVLSLVGVLVWGFFALPRELIPARLLTIQQELQSGTLSNRTYIWDAILSRGLDLFGVGFGAGPAFMGEATGKASVSHNVFLGVLLEVGLLGLMLYVFALLRAVRAGFRSSHRELLMFLAPPLAAAAMTLSLETRRVWWLLLALAWAAAPDTQKMMEGRLRGRTTVGR